MTRARESSHAFVGRSDAQASIEFAWSAARRGRPRLVLVDGPPGFGKTALLGHWLGRLDATAGVRVLRATAEQDESSMSYGVLGQLVRGWGRQLTGPLAAAARGEGVTADPLAVGVHLLTALDGLQRRAAGSGLVMAVDDLQWADAASLRALVFAFRRLREAPIMSVLTCRTEELPALPASLIRLVEEDALRIHLNAFGLDETRQLARLLDLGDLDTSAARQVVAHTGGSPLYLRAVLAELAAEDVDRRWPRAHQPLPVPASYAQLVVQRLTNCSADAVELTRAASILFTPRPLSLVANLAGIAQPLPALDAAVTAGLLQYPTGDEPLRLTHPLTRAAVYRTIPATHRAELHARTACVLESIDTVAALRHRAAAASGPDPQLATTAGDLGMAEYRKGDWSAAGEWLRLAVQLADPAGSQYERYLSYLVELTVLVADTTAAGELRTTLLARPVSPLREYLRARVETLTADLPSALARATSAWDLAQRHPAQADAELRARIAAERARTNLTLGHVGAAAEWARTALDLVPDDPASVADMPGTLLLARALQGDPRDVLTAFAHLPPVIAAPTTADVDALVARGLLSLWSGDLTQARSDLAGAADVTRRHGPLHLHAGACAYLSETAYRLGDWDLAITQAETALELARDLDHVRSLPMLHAGAVGPHAARGHLAVAEEHAGIALSIAEQLGDLQALLWARVAGARLAQARQDPPAVVAALEPLWHRMHLEVVREPGLLPWQYAYAEALTQLGHHDQAAAVLDVAAAYAATRDLPAVELALVRVRALLAASRGDLEDAMATLGQGARHCARVSDQPFELACFELTAGSLAAQAGRRDEAIIALRRALRTFRGLRAEPWIERANAISRRTRIGVRTESVGDPAPELTGKERRVTELVTSGLTNREIAAELSVSIKTVEYHVSNTLSKLGLRSRAQLAAWHATR